MRDDVIPGPHPDPTVDPRPASGGSERVDAAVAGPAMAAFRDSLALPPDLDARGGVVDDLATHYGFSPDEVVERCRGWVEHSVEEWGSSARETNEDIFDFYRTNVSWAFDVLWYAYLQAELYSYPVSVAIADDLPAGSLRHLDFGSGTGVTSQMMVRLGHRSDMADIATGMLEFARFRHTRRGDEVRSIDLNDETLGEDVYDVITAIDTLVHIPNLADACRTLHAALRPDGLLYANFDVRPDGPENAPHLYEDDLPLRRLLQRTGFVPEASIDGMVVRYRRVDPTTLEHRVRVVRDALMLGPVRRTVRFARRVLRR
ncbi:MAG: class I SAM-dependent methyltransferase [Actinomycetota bacterium]